MGARILVIEDDRDIRRNMGLLLETEGYSVDLAENGQVALQFLNSVGDLPELIILDLMMPVMDGFQFREEQEKSARISNIPVIIMTADGHVEEKKIRTNATATLKKPADINAILNTIESILTNNKS